MQNVQKSFRYKSFEKKEISLKFLAKVQQSLKTGLTNVPEAIFREIK